MSHIPQVVASAAQGNEAKAAASQPSQPAEPQKLLRIHIPPSMKQYAITTTEYIAKNPQYQAVAVGAVIFNRPSDMTIQVYDSKDTRVLLVQRAAHERGFPNKWEVPGGGAEDTDPSIFHSVAREVFEEAGLKLTRFVKELPSMSFTLRKGAMNINKLSFEIAVDGNDGLNSYHPHDCKEAHGTTSTEQKLPAVEIDPKEHQAFIWATQAEVKNDTYPITTEGQRDILLAAFHHHDAMSTAMVAKATAAASEPTGVGAKVDLLHRYAHQGPL